MRKATVAAVVAALAAVSGAPWLLANGTETLGPPEIAVGSGTGTVVAGVGMHSYPNLPNTFTVTVPEAAAVKQVLLYWQGHWTDHEPHWSNVPQVDGDNEISVNGTLVQGTKIGGSTAFYQQAAGPVLGTEMFVAYRADITGLNLVRAGANTLTISDMLFASNFPNAFPFNQGNDGVAVLVIYDEGGDSATIDVRDGLDLAFAGFPAPLNATVPQTFTFGASEEPRAGRLATLAGSVLGPDAAGPRANQLHITFDVGDPIVLNNPWQSHDGHELDALNSTITIPANAKRMTVEAISGGPDGSPASFAWVAAALSVPPLPPVVPPGSAQVIKTISGRALTGTETVTFQLRQDASTTSEGTILESQNATAANGASATFTTLLTGGATYQLCEIKVHVSWHSSLSDLPGAFTPSSAVDAEVDNSVVCVDFTAVSGQTTVFNVNNMPPPNGDARTIGYWKNWSSCSGGNQTPILDQTLTAAKGIAVSNKLTVKTCAPAYSILNKSTIDTGVKMANDPAFNLAAQLLAAKLSIARNAGTCSAASTAVTNAYNLLSAVNFTGMSTWKNGMSSAQRSQANTLQNTLNSYNNNTLCP
jgi:hypothetical protein